MGLDDALLLEEMGIATSLLSSGDMINILKHKFLFEGKRKFHWLS